MSKELDPIVVYSVRDVAEILQIGINQAYKLFKLECFPSFKIGNALRVEDKALREWLKSSVGCSYCLKEI